MTVWSSTYVSLGTITGGSGNTWTVSVGGTYASQTMQAATAGASVPTSADNVFFDTNLTYTVTFDSSTSFKDLTVSDGTVTFNRNIAVQTISVYGNFNIKSGTVWNADYTLSFTGGVAQTINTNGVSIRPVTLSITGGTTLTLLSNINLTFPSSSALSIGTGTLILNGFTTTSSTFSININGVLDSTSGGQVTISGNNRVVLTVFSGATFSGTPYFNLSYTGATGTRTLSIFSASAPINVSGSGSSGVVINTTATDTIAFFGTGFGSIDMTSTNVAFFISSGGGATISGSLTVAAGKTWTASTNTLTFSGASATINTNGVTINSPITVNSTGSLTLNSNLTFIAISANSGRLTVNVGSLTLNGFSLSCAAFYGSSPNINFGSTNINLTCSTPGNTVFSVSGAGTYTGSGKFVSAVNNSKTFAAPAGSNANVVISAGSPTITNNSSFASLDLAGSAGSLGNIAINMLGNLTFGAGTYSGVSVIANANCTLTNNAKTIAALSVFAGTTTLADNLTLATTTSVFILSSGASFDAANNNVSIGVCTLSGSSLSMGSGTWTVTGKDNAWNCSNSSMNVSGTATIVMNSTQAKTFIGAGIQTWPTLNQAGSGTLTISGSNKFQNITNSVQPATIRFTSGTTTKFTNFSLAGTAGNLITVTATSTSQAFFQKPSSWYVGANSVDGGNNTGLTFLTAATVDYLSISYINASVTGPGPGNFFAFF